MKFLDKFKKNKAPEERMFTKEDLNLARREERAFLEKSDKDFSRLGGNSSKSSTHWSDFAVYKRDKAAEQLTFSEKIFKDKPKGFFATIGKAIESFTGGFIKFSTGIGYGYKRPLSPEELFIAQSAVFDKVQKDPIAQAIVNNIVWYVIGEGTNIVCSVPEIKQVVSDFRKLNKMNTREKAIVRSTFMDGEYFAILIVDKDGDVLMRKVHSHEITSIEVQDDIEDPLAFERTSIQNNVQKSEWFPAIGYYKQKKRDWGRDSAEKIPTTFKKAKKYIYYVRYGEEGEIRGRPPMLSVLKYLTYYEEFQEDVMIKVHESSRVVFVYTDKSELPNNMSSKSPVDTGEPAPAGGVLVKLTGTQSLEVLTAKLNNADNKIAGDMVLMTIGSFRNIPMYMLHQDPSQAVYASLKKSDSPFSQMINAEQDFWKNNWVELYSFVIEQAVEKGKLEKEYTVKEFNSQTTLEEVLTKINTAVVHAAHQPKINSEAPQLAELEVERVIEAIVKEVGEPVDVSRKTVDIACNQVFPKLVNEDPLVMSKVLEIQMKMGILSQASACAKVGLDWQEQLGQLLQESAIGADKFKSLKNMDKMEGQEDREHGDGNEVEGGTAPDALERK